MIKNLMLAALIAVSLSAPCMAEVCVDLDWNNAASLRRCQDELASYPADTYETNEEYCESIYWEDEYNCVIPGQEVTVEFCESIVFQDTRKICFEALKKQSTKKEK